MPADGLTATPVRLALSDYKIHTAGLDILPGDTPRMRGTGSSTIMDLQGDIMEITALNDMQLAPDNLTIFLNHDYNVPEDVHGGLTKASILLESGIADLLIEFDVEPENPRAMTTYRMAARRRLGISIGCTVDDYRIEDGPDGQPVLHVTRTTPLEWSIVGIPANQRSWVEHAAAGIFAKNYDPKLAPIVKSLLPTAYMDAVNRLEDKDAREYFTRGVTARPLGDQRISWQPMRRAFVLETSTATRPREIQRDQAVQIVRAMPLASMPAIKTALATQQTVELIPQATEDAAPAAITASAPVEATKGVSGKSGWPIADRDRAWDQGEAEKRLHDYAGLDDEGNFDHAKYASTHFWYDGENADNLTAYKLPFCDVIDGKVMAIPRAIFACAGGHGVNAASIPDDDKATIRNKISAYYARMRDKFDDDELQAPWDKEQKTAPEESMKTKNGQTVEDTLAAQSATPASDPAATPLETTPAAPAATTEETPAGDPPASTDEGQTPATVEASATPETTKAATPAASDVEVSSDGSHVACKGTHSHAHKAFNDQGDDEMHTHSHEHDGDASHKPGDGHDHENKSKATNNVQTSQAPVTTKTLDPAMVEKLALYKSMCKGLAEQLGIPAELTTEKALDMQQVCTLASSIDSMSDTLFQRVSLLSINADAMMQALGMPDYDDQAVVPGGAYYAADVPVTKAGAAISKDRLQKLSMAHHALCMAAGTTDMCKEYQQLMPDNATQGGETTAMPGESATLPVNYGASYTPPDFGPVVESMTTLSATISGALDVTAIAKAAADSIKAEIATQIGATKAALVAVTQDINGARKELAELRNEAASLANMPLGRPEQLNRSVTLDTSNGKTASYAEVAALVGGAAIVTTNDAGQRVKRFVEGQMPRPSLTRRQESLMTETDVYIYKHGGPVDVPMFDDETDTNASE